MGMLCSAPGCHSNCHISCRLDKTIDQNKFKDCVAFFWAIKPS